MSHIGMGVMINQLFGYGGQDPKKYIGKIIKSISLDNANVPTLFIEFEDEIKIKLVDRGQSCCEARYMTCDDNLQGLVGERLVSIETSNGGEVRNDYGINEIVFLKIQTEKSSVTVSTHNEHNGYYGGFSLAIEEE